MPRPSLAAVLGGGDRRSIGRSNEVAALVLSQPKRFPELIACLWSDDPLVRMRAADAAEKVSAQEPALLEPFKAELLGLLVEADQQELRWHLAQMIPRLPLTAGESRRAARIFRSFLKDRGSIVKTSALQALADLSRHDPGLRSEVLERIEEALRTGTPAMKARGRNLLKEFRAGSR
jgi:HEAT repeat protein